jgi:hypothetical protein
MRTRRPDGTPADVDDLHTKWQHLLDLGPGGPDACGHDYECDEYLERNAAVNAAAERVSQRQEHHVFRRLTVHHDTGPLDGLLDRLGRLRTRWSRHDDHSEAS